MRSFTPHARKALCLQRIRRRPPTFSGHWGPPWAQGTGASCGRAPVLPDRDCLRALGACRCVSGSAVVLDPPPRATTHRAALLCPRGRSASLVLRALHAPPPPPPFLLSARAVGCTSSALVNRTSLDVCVAQLARRAWSLPPSGRGPVHTPWGDGGLSHNN